MASLVTEVLANTGLLEKEEVATRMEKVERELRELKEELEHALKERYVEYIPTVDHIGKLFTHVKSLDGKMQDLSGKIQNDISVNLKTSTSDVTKLSTKLEKSNATTAVLVTLCEVHKLVKECPSLIRAEEFVQAADILQTLNSHLRALHRSEYSEMKIVQALKSEETLLRESLFYHLGESWSKTISFKTVPAGQGPEAHVGCEAELSIGKNDKFPGTLQAMETTHRLNNKLQGFSKKLLEHMLYPIIRRPNTQPVADSNKQKTTVGLMRVQTKEESPTSSPEAVYRNILTVLEALSSSVLGQVVRQGGQGGQGEEQGTASIMSMLGSLIWPALCEALLKDCLTPSIPSTSEQLADYKQIFESTRRFEENLQGLDFITKETHPLTDYGKNINIYFANKRCQELLVEARRLMQQDLHNTVEVGGVRPLKEEASQTEKESCKKDVLGSSLTAFPHCHISESVQKLVELCNQTLLEASKSVGQCFQLFYTARSMVGLFCEVVPHYHKNGLAQLPRVAALHHNNCLYLAHQLPLLCQRYRRSFLVPLLDGTANFVDLVPVLRREAAEHFLAQFRCQRDLLQESLMLAGGFQRVAEQENVTSANQAIKQVLHRWSHLKTVWGEVLPASVYTKSLASLVNTVLKDIIDQITRLEDISSDDAYQLHLLVTKLRTETPELLLPPNSKEPVTVEVAVKNWSSFTELLFILESSMQGIVDRWADGKGPLALVFPATTVKSLIRALFQNTDRRANALSKIRK